MLASFIKSGLILLSLRNNLRVASNSSIMTLTHKVQLLQGEYVAKLISSRLVPPLLPTAYKGQMGRIGIVGGSPDYTGAPYYAGQSALKFGADLSFIFCAKQACNPIKSYSPELMVTSFYDQDAVEIYENSDKNNSFTNQNKEIWIEMSEKIIEYLSRIHSLVIGPGLGNTYICVNVYGIKLKTKGKDGDKNFTDWDLLMSF